MRFLILISVLLGSFFSATAGNVIFNWAKPGSLTPPFEAPTSANRYGPYIADSVFTSTEGVKVMIDDSDVKELSQKARFLYGYLTGEVELRVYPSSLITISAPENLQITSVSFTGAKADENYLKYVGEDGIFSGNTWKASTEGIRTVTFEVKTTINCTTTTVVIADNSDVTDITYDTENEPEVWYSLKGVKLTSRPTEQGQYIKVKGNKSEKIIIF